MKKINNVVISLFLLFVLLMGCSQPHISTNSKPEIILTPAAVLKKTLAVSNTIKGYRFTRTTTQDSKTDTEVGEEQVNPPVAH